jgi:hypothetical protein
MMTNTMRTMAMTLVASGLLVGSAWAEQTWICAVTSAVAVDEDGTVGPPDVGDKERPTFFRVDTAKKELTLLAPKSRRGEVTKLDTVVESEGQWLFSGVENGRGLNVVITADGHMTLSVVADGVVWSVFGNVLSADDAK